MDKPEEDKEPFALGTVITGVMAMTLAGGIAGIIYHGQQIAEIVGEMKTHDDNDTHNAAALQAQLDRRFLETRQDIDEVRAQFTGGRAERMTADDSLSKRIDDLNRALAELQRQIAAIEGKLGDSLPNLPPKH